MKLEISITIILLWRMDGIFCNDNGFSTVLDAPELGGNETVKVLSRQRRYLVFPKGASLQLLLELLVHVPTQFRVVVGPTMQAAWPLPSEPLRETSKPSSRGILSEESFLTNDLSHSKKVFSFKSRKVSAKETWTGRKNKIFNDMAALLNLFGMTVGLAWQLPDDPNIYSDFKKKHKMYKRSVFKKMESFMRPGGANGRQCVLRALCESGQRTSSKKEFVREILHKIFSVEEEEDEDVEETHEDKAYRKAHRSTNQDCEALYPDCGFSIFNSVR